MTRTRALLVLALLAAVLVPLGTAAPAGGSTERRDVSAPYEIQGFFQASQYVEAVAVDPVRHRVYAVGNDKLTAYDAESSSILWQTPIGGEQGVTVDPASGVIYVTAFGSRSLQVVHPATGATTQTIPVGLAPNEVELDPETHTLYVANHTNSDPFGFYGLGVSEVSQAGNVEVADIPVNAANNEGGDAVAVDSNDDRLYVGHSHNYHLSVINTGSRALVQDIDLGPDGWVQGIAVDEERGDVWATSGATGSVVVIDQATNEINEVLDAGHSAWGIGINPAQDLAFVADQGDGDADPENPSQVIIFDLNTRSVLTTIPIPGVPHDVAVDVAADKVYVSNITSNRVHILGVPPLYGPGTIGYSARSYTVDAGAPATITVRRRGDLNLESSVAYSTSAGTAVPGTDYTETSGTLTFPVGVSTKTFTVPTQNHGDPQATPTVQLALGTVTGGSLRDPHTATLRLRRSVPPIINDDSPPDTVQTNVSYPSYTFTATGTPAPTFSVASGTLPTGLTLNPSTGVLSGTPTAGGPFTFRVKADNGTAPASTSQPITMTVKVPAAFTAESPPSSGTMGQYWFYNYTASGTPAPTFSLHSGALPCGVSLFANGAVGGVPTDAGTYKFRVRASNGATPDAVSAEATVTMAAGPPVVPDAPTIGGVSAGAGSATVSFMPPHCQGGAAIDSYTVIATPGGATATGSASPVTVPGLTNGTSYTFKVRAHNSAGDSGLSTASAAATPTTVAATTVSAGPSRTILHGQTATVSARLTSSGAPLASRSVDLMSRASSASGWTPVSTLTTNATGDVAAAVKPSRNTQYRFEFDGATGYQPSVSAPQVVSVAPRLSIGLKPTKVVKGKKARVYGVATPGLTGTAVTIQVKTGATWSKVTTTKLSVQKLPDGTSRLGFVSKFKLPVGKHTLRAVVAATAANLAGSSNGVTLKVKKPRRQ